MDWSTPGRRVAWLVQDRYAGNKAACAAALGLTHTTINRVVAGKQPGRKLLMAITQRLNAEVNKALGTDMRETLNAQGLLLTPGSVEDFAKFQAEDMARSKKIITEGNIHVE